MLLYLRNLRFFYFFSIFFCFIRCKKQRVSEYNIQHFIIKSGLYLRLSYTVDCCTLTLFPVNLSAFRAKALHQGEPLSNGINN